MRRGDGTIARRGSVCCSSAGRSEGWAMRYPIVSDVVLNGG
jgi:hypothetical protein